MKMTKTEKFMAGLIAGVVAGGVAAMLIAPKPGKDTRKIVGGGTNAAARQAAHYIGAVRNRVRKSPSDVPASSPPENATPESPATENYAGQLG